MADARMQRSPMGTHFRNEAEFTREALRRLQRIPGVFAWRANTGVRGGIRFGSPGQPDIMAIVGRHGRFFGWELKTGRERPSTVQDAWHRQAVERGAVIVVAYTLDEVLGPVLREVGVRSEP